MFRTYVLPILAALGLILSIRVVVTGSKTPPAAPPVSEPSRSPFPVFVAGSGIVEARSENIAIATPISGVVAKVHVVVGARVAAGDPLFSLDDRELQALHEVRKSGVAVAEADLADAERQLAFWQSVADKRAVSAEELSKRKYAVQRSTAALARARAELHEVSTDLERIVVRAPIDGEVLQVKVRAGEFAPAQALSAPLILLGDTDVLVVRVDVDENEAWRVRQGSNAVAYVRGNRALSTPLTFVRFEPYIVPKRSLTGESNERVDTRVLQVLYQYPREALPAYVGQLLDVYIEAGEAPGQARLPGN